MSNQLDVYECEVCGHIIQVFRAGKGELVCCGQPMTLLEPQTADATTEKHVPIFEKSDGGLKVIVGSTPHPMTEEHLIEWIEAIDGDNIHVAFLKAGDAPEATFDIDAEKVEALEHCNVHGLWKG